MNDIEQIEMAASFAALSHKSRISLFLELLACANSGCRFGELQKSSKIPASTLSHHLNEMEGGGIIERIPVGRATLIRLRLNHLQNILSKMMSQCCINEGNQDT